MSKPPRHCETSSALNTVGSNKGNFISCEDPVFYMDRKFFNLSDNFVVKTFGKYFQQLRMINKYVTDLFFFANLQKKYSVCELAKERRDGLTIYLSPPPS